MSISYRIIQSFRDLIRHIEQDTNVELKGTTCQVAMLIGASLQTISPDTDKASDDANALEVVFCGMAAELQLMDGGDTDYSDDAPCEICGGNVEETEDDDVCVSCKEAAIEDGDDEPDDSRVSPNGPSDRTFDEGPN